MVGWEEEEVKDTAPGFTGEEGAASLDDKHKDGHCGVNRMKGR